MDARFHLANPEQAPLTLTMTAPLKEWRALMNDLGGATDDGVEFARKLSRIIAAATKEVTSERWTTGYADGVAQSDD